MRYFIDIVTDKQRVPDLEGQDFTDLSAARDEAIQSLRDLLADRLRDGGYIHMSWRANVRDEKGDLPFEIPVQELISDKSIGDLFSNSVPKAVSDHVKLRMHAMETFRRAKDTTRQIQEDMQKARAQLQLLGQLTAAIRL